jgi:hypothetical protein
MVVVIIIKIIIIIIIIIPKLCFVAIVHDHRRERETAQVLTVHLRVRFRGAILPCVFPLCEHENAPV